MDPPPTQLFPNNIGSSSGSGGMPSNFGLKGPETPWVCPNDRNLALRAKLRTGWSVKTSQFNTYPRPQPLTDLEQQMIISVVKKAEELDLSEQKRVGKLVDRLESLKKLASGNGVTECVLCGDSFGLSVFGRSNYKCCDCKKAVCRKCVVELSPASSSNSGSGATLKDSLVRLCKICSENRELIKRSGAWFYKGVPKHILPEKKNHYRNNYESSSCGTPSVSEERKYMSRYLNSHVINSTSGSSSKRMGICMWSRGLRSQSECENDSSSGDEALLTCGRRVLSDKVKGVLMGPDPTKSLHNVSSSEGNGRNGQEKRSFERFEPSGSMDRAGTAMSDNNTTRSSGSSSTDMLLATNTTTLNSSPPSPTSSSHHDQNSPYGTIEISVLYDDTHQALHCTVHNIKDLTPMDIEGLSDPYCVLKLSPSRFQEGHHRTKTVHKTLNPVYNETLTFYGLSPSHLSWQSLQINVIDDDRWARDCLGFAQIPLQRIRPQQTRPFSLGLDSGKQISAEEKECGRGSLMVSLCYLSEESTLIVGLVKAKNLPVYEALHVGSDGPFVKVKLLHDIALGPDSGNSSSTGSRKLKSGVKLRTKNPEFHEEFSFRVSIIDLPRLALVISVWDKGAARQSDYIGGLVLSCSCKGDRLKHWTDMIKLPNSKYTNWHSLSHLEVPSA